MTFLTNMIILLLVAIKYGIPIIFTARLFTFNIVKETYKKIAMPLALEFQKYLLNLKKGIKNGYPYGIDYQLRR